jgi:hypothetical protein
MPIIKWLIYGVLGIVVFYYSIKTNLKWWLLGAFAIFGAVMFVRFMVRLGQKEDSRN